MSRLGATRNPITMERLLVWTIQTKRADRHATETGLLPLEAQVDGRHRQGYSSDGCVAGERFQRLGTFVDVSRTPLNVDLDPDAENVWRALQRHLRGPTLSQAIFCARRGDRPPDGSDIKPFRLEPILVWAKRDEPGLAKVNGRWEEHSAGEAYWPKIRQLNKGGQRYCPIEVKDFRWERMTVREKYEDWWRGLRRLSWHFQGVPEELRRWKVTGVGVPEPSWIVEKRSRKSLDKIEGD